MHVREYQVNYIIILVQFLLIATVECTNLLSSSFQYSKGLYPATGPLDYQPGLSLEDCVSLCWEEDLCKSLNYHRHATLCELNRVDKTESNRTYFKEDTGSIYSEKRSWAEVLFLFLSFNSSPESICSQCKLISYVYVCSDIRSLSIRRLLTISKHFSSETTWTIKAYWYVNREL